jgi:hypothetical protein
MAAIPQDKRHNLPWAGPMGPPYEQRKTLEQPASFPIQNADNPNIFPKVVLRSHWDPEQIIRRTLPNQQVPSIIEPRPYTKVCLNYVTSAPFEQPPMPPDNLVYPSGGTVYPPSRYKNSIDDESKLRRLDRTLGLCETEQYIPGKNTDLYVPRSTVPDRAPPSDRFINELAFPRALIRDGVYQCRAEQEFIDKAKSPLLFNNSTKQDRNKMTRSGNNDPR